MLNIQKIDESFLKITGNIEDKKVIYEWFRKPSPNYFYNPLYKSGKWDGHIKFFDMISGKLPYGLFSELIKCIETNEIECGIDEKLLNQISDFESIPDFEKYAYKNLNKEYVPRYYQKEGAIQALKSKRGLFEHATRSGKTLTLFLIINYIYNKYIIEKEKTNIKIMFVVPNIGLINQFMKDFNDYGISENVIGKYYAKTKEIDKPIIVGTWQSLHKAKSLLPQITFLIADEVHGHSNSAVIVKKLSEECINAKIRLGVTGTFSDLSECDRFSIIGSFGPVLSTIKTHELIHKDIIVPPKIKVLNIDYSIELKKQLRALQRKYKKDKKDKNSNYVIEKKFIITYPKRRKLVDKLVGRHLGETMLLLFNERKMGNSYLEHLKEIYPNKHILYVDGNISGDDREKIRQRAINEKGIIIVASLKTFSTGITLPNLTNIIFLWIGKSAITLKQSIGRGLGKHDDKTHVTIYDLCDQLPFSKKHGLERLKIYMNENFDVTTYDIKI